MTRLIKKPENGTNSINYHRNQIIIIMNIRRLYFFFLSNPLVYKDLIMTARKYENHVILHKSSFKCINS